MVVTQIPGISTGRSVRVGASARVCFRLRLVCAITLELHVVYMICIYIYIYIYLIGTSARGDVGPQNPRRELPVTPVAVGCGQTGSTLKGPRQQK